MSQRYKDNTKRPKPKENQLRNLKRALDPGERERESCWGYVSMKMHLLPKSCYNFT